MQILYAALVALHVAFMVIHMTYAFRASWRMEWWQAQGDAQQPGLVDHRTLGDHARGEFWFMWQNIGLIAVNGLVGMWWFNNLLRSF